MYHTHSPMYTLFFTICKKLICYGRLENQAAENMALKQRAEGYRNEAGALESRLALIKAQRNKLLAAFEGFAGQSFMQLSPWSMHP